ncbi:hypothetical protein HAX54_022844 [Datura stramonium]|uniref:Uncharacterized protein n=1 Tax=Datura stramonium TaxID=4076 RepID=A0ABS8UXF6_DATST|nr:hypothetical protein [Datura stramonium]
MAPKASRGKGVASSSHENKRYRLGQETPNEDARMQPQPPKCYGLHWFMEQEEGVDKDKGEKRQRLSFGGFLTQFLRGHQIDEEVVNYRPWYDPKGIDVKKKKKPEGIHCLCCPSVKEQIQQLNMDYRFSEHSRALYRVGPRIEEPLDDYDATDEEKARVDSNLESKDDGDDSKMGEVVFARTDDED